MAQDKKFSVIIPLHKKNYETLERAMLCVNEQDYKNHEVILVHDSTSEAHKYLRSKKSPLKWYKGKVRQVEVDYLPELERGNHCRSFNKGAEVADGDYLIFCDPDVYYYPGIFREYKDAFEANPDVDFVYGDYDLDGNQGRIQGRPYNEYELRCANYISGGFPVKKSAFKGWDENIQSLQDWDMWLSVVDNGSKGFYLERPCFSTGIPQEGGISADSAHNWLERYTTVRTKHGFPPSDTVVTSLGAPFHATNVAKILGADSRVLTNLHVFKPHEYKNTYLIGFYPKGWHQHMRLFYENGDTKKDLFGSKRIIHWVGTDIYQMQHDLSWMAWKNISGFLNDKDFNFIHLTEAEHTQAELRELGIESQVVPLPTPHIHDLVPLPEEFTVGVYINPTQDMYFEDFMYDITAALPDIKFKFFGNANKKMVDGNREWVGWVDMKEFLPTVSAIVRLTVHDGLPISPIEAMQAGRNVLASFPLKHALTAEYKDGVPQKSDVVEKIRQLEKMPLNQEGSDYWRKEMNHDLFRERINSLLA